MIVNCFVSPLYQNELEIVTLFLLKENFNQ